MIVKNSYIARNGDGDGPSTPWGPAQFSYILHRGVVFYSTASRPPWKTRCNASMKARPSR